MAVLKVGCLVVLCLFTVICSVVGMNDEDSFDNLDSFANTIEETYTNALRLGIGIIVAIVIGAIAVIVIVIVLCACCCYHCCCKSPQPRHSTVVVTNQPGGMVLQQPVAYEPVNGPNSGPNSEPDALPPHPDQQASYGYVKL